MTESFIGSVYTNIINFKTETIVDNNNAILVQKMATSKTKNAVNALLAEYKKSIFELQYVIETISDETLAVITDPETKNEDCKSIQTILAHVINSGYSYCVYIRKSRNENIERPEKIIRKSVKEYKNDLNNVLLFTDETFKDIYDDNLESFNESEKIKTAWGQLYDIEQLFEHAIVHILRHRRQIENFKIKEHHSINN